MPSASSMFQTRLIWLFAFTAADAPLTYIALPPSARTSPYCCMARATIWASGPMVAIRLLTAVA